MTTKTYLITGPTRGLGRELVRSLVAGGSAPALVLVGRPGIALDETAAEARRRGAASVSTIGCDLSSMTDVRAAIAAFESRPELRDVVLDGFVGNAALQMLDACTPTVDGFETTFAIGILAHHLLLRGLRSRLAPDAHVIMVGSGTHYGKPPATFLVPAPRWRDPAELARPWTDDDAASIKAGQRAYSTMKLGVNYLVNEWSRREPTLRVNVYDPGLMPGTGLVRSGPAWRQAGWSKVMPVLRVLPGVTSAKHSAAQLAAMLTGASHAQLRGGYVEIGRVKVASAESNDPSREARLWDVCEQLTSRE